MRRSFQTSITLQTNLARALTALALLGLLLLPGACRPAPDSNDRPGDGPATALEPTPLDGLTAVDAGGRAIEELESGSSLEVGAGGLEPLATYELRLTLAEGEPSGPEDFLSFARIGSDGEGRIDPFVLWYHSGVVGCSQRLGPDVQLGPFQYRTFDEAEEALAGRSLRVTLHRVTADEARRGPLVVPTKEPAVAAFDLPVARRRSPMVYPSREDGCLINSREVGSEDLYLSGRGFTPGETVELSVVPNQRLWRVGDAIRDVSGAGGAAAPVRATVGEDGRFTARAWERSHQFQGTFDFVARRLDQDAGGLQQVGPADLVSYHADTGFILYLIYPVGGPTMDLAGRPISGSPYFQFADSFADQGDTVWGAVDPTYVPAGHTGGSYAAYYVVDHRDVAGWDPLMGGATNLVDVSGGFEVMRVKAGCVNGTDVPIWHAPLTLGDYDVVVDFGAMPAETQAAYATDANFDDAVDFLDGANQIGFKVAKDPLAPGSFPVGRSTYSQDNFFATLGGASNVDLRAVVRYPATAAGVDTPTAAGQHPLFLIEHGNHAICEVATDGTPWYDRLADAYAGIITWQQLSNLTHTHVSCPVRIENHAGYTGLLNALASHGVIAVSIDAYDLTGSVPGWIAERGDLILKHIELWSHMDDVSTFPAYPDFFAGRFANHVDLTKISVSGHSRGGEASVAAYMRNLSLPNPFSIGSVSSIAPVDFNGYVLPAVPYFVILPAADGDVANLSGQPIYDRAGSGLAPVDSTTKSGIHVYGANHNFFNTVWAGHWDDWTDSHPAWPPRPDFIPAPAQQTLGEVYLAAFTRVHLLGETVYLDLLRGGMTFPSTAGRKIYGFHHETNHSKLEAGTGAGVPAAGASESVVNGPSVHTTQAVQVGWNASTATYTYTVPLAKRDASTFEVLSFRVAQTNSGTNPATGTQRFQVELVGGGQTKATYSDRFDEIPQPYDRVGTDHNVMTTVRIPLHSFIMNNAGVTLNNVDTVRFKFTSPAAGEIYVDDLEFSR